MGNLDVIEFCKFKYGYYKCTLFKNIATYAYAKMAFYNILLHGKCISLKN